MIRLLYVYSFTNPSIRIFVDYIAQCDLFLWISQLLGVSVGVREARHEGYSLGLGTTEVAVLGAVVRLEDEEYCERTRREAAGGDAAGSRDSSTSAPETWCRATLCFPKIELMLCS